MSYSRLERDLGRMLDRFPALRRVTKALYQRASYCLTRRGGERATVHPAVAIESAITPSLSLTVPQATEYFVGYFGMTPWSRDQRRFLLHRLGTGGSRTVELCVLEERGSRVSSAWDTPAWTYQQGSMAQWSAHNGGERLAFNDVCDGRLGCRMIEQDGAERWFDRPVQVVHPRGSEFLSINYRRLCRIGSEYGYDVDATNMAPDGALADDGIWRVQVGDGDCSLIVALSDLVGPAVSPEMARSEHEVNHLVYSPGGARFAFMHRWRGPAGRRSRLYVASGDGSKLRLLLDHGMVSHYAWRDDDTILVWARTAQSEDRYSLVDVNEGAATVVAPGVLDRLGDGHPSYSPDGRWIVTDSYPDRARRRHLVLYECSAQRLVEVGAFFAPWTYEGARRCDLHPRWSPDGRSISFDSAHDGVRRSYIADVSRIVTG